MPVRYILSSVWVRLSIFSQLSIHYRIHYTICGAVCFQFTHSPCDDWENIYILCLIVIIKSEVLTIIHCLGLGHETMVCAICLSIFLRVFCAHITPYNISRSLVHAKYTRYLWSNSLSLPRHYICGCFRYNYVSYDEINPPPQRFTDLCVISQSNAMHISSGQYPSTVVIVMLRYWVSACIKNKIYFLRYKNMVHA